MVDEKTIRFGLNAIKNLGSDVIEKIIEVRKSADQLISKTEPVTSLENFLTRAYTKNLTKRSWEALAKAGALDAFGERGQLVNNTEEVLAFLRENFKHDKSGQESLFGKSYSMGRLTLKPSAPATKEEMLLWEKEHLGMYVSAHPLDVYKNVLGAMRNVRSLTLDELGANVVMGGIISRLKKTLTRKNDPMAFFTLEDLSGNIEVLVFPKVMEKALPYLADDKIVQVSGRLSDKDEEFKLIAEDIKELPTDDLYGMAFDQMEKNSKLIIHMASLSNMEVLNKIKEILEANKGGAQVFLSVGAGQGSKKIKTQSQVRVSNELLSSLRKLAEIQKVDVE